MKSVFIIFILFLSSSTFAENPKEIIIASASWKGATNRDGSGLYWKIIEEVYKPFGYSIIKKHRSYAEATEMLRTNNADMYLGSYPNEKDFALYPKYYFDQDIIVAIYRRESIEEWDGQKSLEGLKVGWIRGYDFDKYLSNSVQIKESNNRNNGLKQLMSERIDAFIDDRDDIKPYLKKIKLPSDEFEQKIILQLKLYPAFIQTSKGKKLMKIWDDRMKVLIETEEFKRLYYESEYTIFPY